VSKYLEKAIGSQRSKTRGLALNDGATCLAGGKVVATYGDGSFEKNALPAVLARTV
jgi:hypothetical protein